MTRNIQRPFMSLVLMMLALFAYGQTEWVVSTEDQLNAAIRGGRQMIKLDADIQLVNSYLDINGKTVTIDLNGHRLYRSLDGPSSDGHVIWVHNNGDLTLTSNAEDYGMTSFTIGSCRAYFKLNNGLVAGETVDPASDTNKFVLNLGENTSIHHSPFTIHNAAGWYTLDGLQLSVMPTQEGIYIYNGKKMVVK